MSEEEKQAIKRLEKFGDSISCANYPPEAYFEMKDDIEDVLYLIEKQQEEIEELKDRNKELTEAIEEWINGERINDIKHISKDKIREFIKKELPDDDIMVTCNNYDINGVLIREKLEQLLEE